MVANRRRDTQPELRVRRLLHAAGLRYTIDARPDPAVRGKADIVFNRRRIVVFIDGCFWHGCPVHAVQPKSNTTYWGPKLARNRERDLEVTAALLNRGWTVLRFWEHEPADSVARKTIDAWNRWEVDAKAESDRRKP